MKKSAATNQDTVVDLNNTSEPECSFCGLPQSGLGHLYSGKDAYICEQCLVAGARQLDHDVVQGDFGTAGELANSLFSQWQASELVSYQKAFDNRLPMFSVRTMNDAFADDCVQSFAVHNKNTADSEAAELEYSALIRSTGSDYFLDPVKLYNEADCFDPLVGYAPDSLWVLVVRNLPVLMLVSTRLKDNGLATLSVELTLPKGPVAENTAKELFSTLSRRANDSEIMQDREIVIQRQWQGNKPACQVEVMPIEKISRKSLVMPSKLAWSIDDGILKYIRNVDTLRIMGHAVKRTILISGAPGTGKTWISRYLAGKLQQCTVIRLNAENARDVSTGYEIARHCQPALVIIDDLDRMMRVDSNPVGVKALFYELEKLKDSDQVFTVLTATDYGMLDQAGVVRPGNIDQVIRLGMPGELERRQLTRLYGKGLGMHDQLVSEIVLRTDGFSPAAIRELMRRIALISIQAQNNGEIRMEQLDLAFSDLVQARQSVAGSMKELLANMEESDSGAGSS